MTRPLFTYSMRNDCRYCCCDFVAFFFSLHSHHHQLRLLLFLCSVVFVVVAFVLHSICTDWFFHKNSNVNSRSMALQKWFCVTRAPFFSLAFFVWMNKFTYWNRQWLTTGKVNKKKHILKVVIRHGKGAKIPWGQFILASEKKKHTEDERFLFPMDKSIAFIVVIRSRILQFREISRFYSLCTMIQSVEYGT